MDPGLSPFRPGLPAPVECFVGRHHEIERLYQMARASTRGRLMVGFIAGERGIGKSSLASFVRSRCEREGAMAGCHVFLGGAQNLHEMMRKIFDQLLKESIDQPWHKKAAEFFGNRIRKVGLFGITVELDLQEQDLSALAKSFGPSIQEFIKKTGKQGLLLILDDINGLAGSAQVAHWIKSTIDELSISQPEVRLCVLIVGLEERRQALIQHQESLARVFSMLNMEAWSRDETREFYTKTFASAGARISTKDLESLVEYTGGLPVFAHELGDSAWRMAKTLEIDKNAVIGGIVDATEIIGRKLLDQQVFDAIRSEKYRSILKKMMRHGPVDHFRRSEVAKDLTKEEIKVFDNFLQRMRKLGALTQDPTIRGGYQFPNRLYSLYFSFYSHKISSQNHNS
ncbi:MAG: ATP-binding protein [Synechococcus sp. SB0662_bin_45]|nr:ATP-binding protein [Synechococcus sp. SB0668_bin_13]MYE21628.1 ATP-binding protein [Synechococcus sp. SB0662_bin_45]